jgi:hypothetical protein
MKTSEDFNFELNSLKGEVISEIRFYVRSQPEETLDISRSPRITTVAYNDQESETIDELKMIDDKVIAFASLYNNETEYDIEGDFDISMCIEILRSVEKHLQMNR